jgi:hypothetical protein
VPVSAERGGRAERGVGIGQGRSGRLHGVTCYRRHRPASTNE